MLFPLLIPPLLLVVTSVSLLPLLFFMQLCDPLQVAFTVEKFFIINLDFYHWCYIDGEVLRLL